MRVKDIMNSTVHSVQATDTIAAAGRSMSENDVGLLPVLDGRKLVGVVTDRDIAVRSVGAGLSADQPVQRIMTKNVATCSQDVGIEDALEIMSNEQVRRIPVCGDREDIIGIVTLADVAERHLAKVEVADTLAEICEPTKVHNQSREIA